MVKKSICAVLYRHPRHNFSLFQTQLVDKLKFLDNQNLTYYICGDTNINLIKASTNSGIKYFFDDLTSAGTQVLVNKPTRIVSNSASLVDHLYTNDPVNKLTPGIIVTDMSDHLPLFLKVSTLNPSQNNNANRMIRDWKNFNKDAFRKELKTKLTLFSSNTQNLDPNAKFNRFMKIADTVVNKYLPLRPCTNKEQRRRENPWMTNAIFKSIKNKDKLYFIKMKYRLAINEQRYKQYRNYLNRIIRKAKKDYYITKLQASANKSKAIWSVINEILSKKRKELKLRKLKPLMGNIQMTPNKSRMRLIIIFVVLVQN